MKFNKLNEILNQGYHWAYNLDRKTHFRTLFLTHSNSQKERDKKVNNQNISERNISKYLPEDKAE